MNHTARQLASQRRQRATSLPITLQQASQPASQPGNQAARQADSHAAKQPANYAATQPSSHAARQPARQQAIQPASQPSSQQVIQPGSHAATQPGSQSGSRHTGCGYPNECPPSVPNVLHSWSDLGPCWVRPGIASYIQIQAARGLEHQHANIRSDQAPRGVKLAGLVSWLAGWS